MRNSAEGDQEYQQTFPWGMPTIRFSLQCRVSLVVWIAMLLQWCGV